MQKITLLCLCKYSLLKESMQGGRTRCTQALHPDGAPVGEMLHTQNTFQHNSCASAQHSTICSQEMHWNDSFFLIFSSFLMSSLFSPPSLFSLSLSLAPCYLYWLSVYYSLALCCVGVSVGVSVGACGHGAWTTSPVAHYLALAPLSLLLWSPALESADWTGYL